LFVTSFQFALNQTLNVPPLDPAGAALAAGWAVAAAVVGEGWLDVAAVAAAVGGAEVDD
jgi:hypothetical protein